MARFDMVLPDDVMKEFQKIYKESDKIFGEMTKAGAEVAMKNVRDNIPPSFTDSEIMRCLKLTKTYKTPSDDGINTKVGFYGYFRNSKGEIVPAPLVANVFEYGSSKLNKYPFFRKSFNPMMIRKAMLQKQKEASGGLLENE